MLQDDTQSISTGRCLRLYLERLGHSFLDPRAKHALGGLPQLLATEALFDISLLNCRPSVVAAALLYAERRLRGAVPFWPSMLAKLTGYCDMSSPELTVAVRTVQKLCRKSQPAALYKERAALLARYARTAALQGAAAALRAAAGAALPSRIGTPRMLDAQGSLEEGDAVKQHLRTTSGGDGTAAAGAFAPAGAAWPGAAAQLPLDVVQHLAAIASPSHGSQGGPMELPHAAGAGGVYLPHHL